MRVLGIDPGTTTVGYGVVESSIVRGRGGWGGGGGGSEPARERAALVLRQLMAPARDVLGPEAGEAVAKAAKRVKG